MKIYLASSWKNHELVRIIARRLRNLGYDVDDFTDDSEGRFVFSYKEITEDHLKLNAKIFMKDKRAKRAFKEDKSRIDWADVLICILPCGNSAHMELGYAAGSNKKVIVFAPNGFEPGEWDVMYGFAIFMTDSFNELSLNLNELEQEIYCMEGSID